MSAKTKVVVYGCGVMGRRVAGVLLDKENFEVAGAIDIHPDLVGKDLGEVLGRKESTGVVVSEDAEAVLAGSGADAAVLTTVSHLKDVEPQIERCAAAGVDVISTCEELAYPWKRQPDRARKIDELARSRNITVVGTGINPGFLMDTLPLVLTAPCLRVDAVKVVRMMDSSKRRVPFQKKVGTNMTVEEFRRNIEDGTITGHVGLLESIHTIAEGLSWELDEATELPPEPVVATEPTESCFGTVPKGKVVGLRSVAHGKRGGENVITLEFVANAAVKEEYDEVAILGDPDLRERVLGGVHGDTGTVAMTVNTIPRAVEAAPGLRLMKDLAVPACVP